MVLLASKLLWNFGGVMASKPMLYCKIDIVYFGLNYFSSKARLIHKNCVYMVKSMHDKLSCRQLAIGYMKYMWAISYYIHLPPYVTTLFEFVPKKNYTFWNILRDKKMDGIILRLVLDV